MIEQRLSEIVASLLGRKRVDIGDDFFLLGGYSLLAMQLIARVREAFEVELSLRTLFDAPTIKDLSIEVERLLLAKRSNE
jgi:acyl carrier protein